MKGFIIYGKIFVQKDHRELENTINNWISSSPISIIDISHSICILKGLCPLFNVIIRYNNLSIELHINILQ